MFHDNGLVEIIEAGASQRYTDTMRANAAAVLAQAYRAPFGAAAPAVAGLVIRHMMSQLPVPDGATLRALGDALTRLQAHFFAQHDVDREDRKLIRWETARRWGHTSRCALRSGTIGLADAMRARPDHLGLGHTGFEDLVVSRLIGSARAAKRRYRG